MSANSGRILLILVLGGGLRVHLWSPVEFAGGCLHVVRGSGGREHGLGPSFSAPHGRGQEVETEVGLEDAVVLKHIIQTLAKVSLVNVAQSVRENTRVLAVSQIRGLLRCYLGLLFGQGSTQVCDRMVVH